MKKAVSIVVLLCMILSLFTLQVGAAGEPATPKNILFTPVTTDSVTITWDASEGATSYNVYRREAGKGTLEKIATVTDPTYVDTTVEKAHDYYYSVTAVNANGESAGTNEAFIMTAGDRAVLLNYFNIKEIAGPACRLRIGDLDGDGRNDILAVNTAQNTSDARNPRVVWSVTAFSIEGEMMWQWFANPETPIPNMWITKTGADEPCQIQDVDGDGYNEVVLVGNPTYDPYKSSNVSTSGDVFYILDGKDGSIKHQKSFAEAGLGNNLHDCIVLGNFDGRTVNGRDVNQFMVLKERYGNIQVFELFDKETQEFTFKKVWGYNESTKGQAVAGHMPLATDLDGDGKDELLFNYTVMNGDGTVRWKVPNEIRDEEGNLLGTATDHVDTIQVGDVDGNPENGLEVVLGGGGAGMSTFCFTADGELLWTNNIAHEPQSLILADFRTEAKGLELYGLDRRNRSNYPVGHDGLFLVGSQGEDLYKEPDNPQGWSTIVVRMPNWTGTWAPLSLAFFRNDQANAADPDKYPDATENNWLPSIYDGYFNVLFELPGQDARFMVANLVGDSRDEIVGYTDQGDIWIYANGEAPMDSLVTGTPRQQTDFLGNYSRYPTDKFEVNLAEREPAAPVAENVQGNSAFINWTPVIGATGYTLYRNGEKIGDFTDVGYQETDLPLGTYEYTVVATDGTVTSPESYPLTLAIEKPVAQTDKGLYNVNETITVSIKTLDTVTRVGLANEAGNSMAVDNSYFGVDNGDGTKTFTVTLALGSAGTRELTVLTAGDDGELTATDTTVSFTVSNTPIAPPEGDSPKVISAKLVSGAMKVNTPITFEVKTNTDVAKVAFFNESGAGLAGSRTYEDADGVRTWTITLSIGSAGKRTLDLKYQGNDGVWVDTDKTVTFTLGR